MPTAQQRKALPLRPVDLFTATLVDRTRLSQRTYHLKFSKDGVANFSFQPGQWIAVRFRDDTHHGWSSYSIASAPCDGNCFDLCVKAPSSAPPYWQDDFYIGRKAIMRGPHGAFTLRMPVRNALFVAAGTGIAPIRSMLRWFCWMGATSNLYRAWLIFGASEQKELYYHNEFRLLAESNPLFRYIPTVSRDVTEWDGAQGRVQHQLQNVVSEISECDAYICGPAEMVKSVQDFLRRAGWSDDAIHYERF